MTTEEPAGQAQSQQVDPSALESSEESVGTPAERADRTWAPLILLAAVAAYAALGLAAGLAWGIAFLVLLAVTQLVDLLVVTEDYIRATLARAQFGIATRSLTRELATVALVLGADWASTGTRRAAALAVLGVAGLRLLYQLVLVPLRRRVVTPVETLNIDLSGLRLPVAPPLLMMTRISERTHGVSLVALLGAATGVVAESRVLLFVVVGLVLLAELVAVGTLSWYFLRARRALSREELLAAVQARVATLRPEVMLYHTGDAESAYQVNMWLGTVDRLRRSSIIVLRERASMQLLGPTTTPVLCIPGSVDFMTFGLQDIRVAMYTANVGKTIHMLREPGVQHVFIGHGDSDKTASSNPFSKVYSEIWVAGEAGRDRYRRANIGIHDEDIVEVGRPQLDGIDGYSGSVSEPVTVLYAPTWEGWTNDPAHTSVIRTGPALIERLVSLPGVRVVYKPHPLTGSVSRAAVVADAKMRATIARAAAPAGAPKHAVAFGPSPSLYECFNDADVLVADISSVLTDFIESQKPYIVTNLTGLPDDEFRTAFPSTSAAYLLDPGAEQIGAIFDLIRVGDPLAEERSTLKHYLLGPDEPSAQERFAAAVDAAYDRAVTLCPVRPTLSVTAV
jgi:hypothetical protein